MTRIVNVRGQLFEIVADGDWGGGDQSQAIEDVERKLRALSLSKLIALHEALEEEQQEHPMRRARFSDEAFCDPIVSKFAHPPEDDLQYGASLHLRAVMR